jgi:hypothetical protein
MPIVSPFRCAQPLHARYQRFSLRITWMSGLCLPGSSSSALVVARGHVSLVKPSGGPSGDPWGVFVFVKTREISIPHKPPRVKPTFESNWLETLRKNHHVWLLSFRVQLYSDFVSIGCSPWALSWFEYQSIQRSSWSCFWVRLWSVVESIGCTAV